MQESSLVCIINEYEWRENWKEKVEINNIMKYNYDYNECSKKTKMP